MNGVHLSPLSPGEALPVENLPLQPRRNADFRDEQLCPMPIVLCFVFDLFPRPRDQWRVFLWCRRRRFRILRRRLGRGRLEPCGHKYPRVSSDLVSTECERGCEPSALANRCKPNRLLVLRARQPYRHCKSTQAWTTTQLARLCKKCTGRVFARVCSHNGPGIQESTATASQDHEEQKKRRGCDVDTVQSSREEIQGAVSSARSDHGAGSCR